MTDINIIKDELKALLSEKRFYHSESVAKRAVELAEIYGEDKEKAYIAGLVHDACKEISKDKQLKIINDFGIILSDIEKTESNIWHGYAASAFVKEKWAIEDEDILNSVKFHTCGRKNMSTLEKIVFVADLTSYDRDYPDSEKIRKISEKSLDEAIYNCYLYILPFIINRQGRITQNTVDCYNDSVKNITKER